MMHVARKSLLGSSVLATILALGCSTAQSEPRPVAAKAAAPAKRADGPREVAIVAGGCFWGMENVMRQAPGVLEVEVGYAGGPSSSVSYEAVSSGKTGHAEAVRIVFDPSKLSYEELLARWYFRGHDPTTKDRQNNDVGTQYRSEIFTTTEAQRATAAAVKARVERSGKWLRPIVTMIEPATTFVRAEPYHQEVRGDEPHAHLVT